MSGEYVEIETLDYASEVATMHVVTAACSASMAFMCWEHAITFADEVECMWRGKMSLVKILFFYSRYFAIGGQIANKAVYELVHARPASSRMCRIWYGYQTVVGQGMLTALEIVLMIRVHALYNRSRRLAVVLAFVVILELGVTGFSSISSIRAAVFNDNCLAIATPRTFVYMYFCAALTQSIIIVLTLFKHFVALRSGWGRTPIVSLLIRDGALVFIVLAVVFAVTILYAVAQRAIARATFPTLVAIISSASCRLIINMQQLRIPESQDDERHFEFSTRLYDVSNPPSCPAVLD